MPSERKPISCYCAGPQVFLDNAVQFAKCQVEICSNFGLVGRAPSDTEVRRAEGMTDEEFGLSIYLSDLKLMSECDIIIANLTPFRGPSADSGTIFELGWFVGKGRPAFGYSNSARSFQERTTQHLKLIADPLPNIQVEAFGALPDNLMIPGGLLSNGIPLVTPASGEDEPFDSLDTFEGCVELVVRHLTKLN